MKFNYNNIYKKYNMTGEIRVGTGILKVHDIFDPIPEFMLSADALFCDPPCSKGNLTSFYTKAEKENRTSQFVDFANRLISVIDEINPRIIFIELFKSDKDFFETEISKKYHNVKLFNSMYYHKKSNKCWILMASNDELPDANYDGLDEEIIISRICKDIQFDCIADPCMGKGLVAFYANAEGKKFVGTELNEKRLAVAVERVYTGLRGKMN